MIRNRLLPNPALVHNIFIIPCIAVGMVFILAIASCTKIEDYESTLIVNNLNGGKSWVRVYPGDMPKETLDNYYKKTNGFVALANGQSPFNLIWYESISSGNRFVIIQYYPDPDSYHSTTRIGIAQFSGNGNATIDWSDMIEYNPYNL